MAISILEGSTFCVCDERGDVGGWPTSGFFADDTRFLSLLRLTINGESPLVLSSGRVEYFSAAFYLRNPLAGDLRQDEVSVMRERFVGDEGMQDRLVLQNQGMRAVAFDLELEVGCDFADIFAVKEYDFALGDPDRAEPLPPLVRARYDEGNNQFLLQDASGVAATTQVIFSRRGEVDGGKIHYRVELEPRARWDVRLDIVPSLDGDQLVPRVAQRRFGDELGRVRESLSAWRLRVPQIRATWDDLQHAFARSVSDLASLRMRGAGGRLRNAPGRRHAVVHDCLRA